jgi:hypothetical protein
MQRQSSGDQECLGIGLPSLGVSGEAMASNGVAHRWHGYNGIGNGGLLKAGMTIS